MSQFPLFRTATAKDLKRIYAFVYPLLEDSLSRWSHRFTMGYFLYYAKSGLLGISEDNGKITAVVMGRPVTTLAQGVDDRFALDWNGKILWVECVVSVEGLRNVWERALHFLTRYGCRFTHVAWNRPKHNWKPVIQPIDRVEERIEALS